MTDTQPLTPTDAEIVALADATRTAEGGANGYILPISFARAVLAKWGAQPVAPREPTPEFNDPRVQAVYDILCDDTDLPPKEAPQQHWEGWIARRVVERLFQEPVEGANAQDMRYANGGVAERCEEVKRAMDVAVELERRGMLEAQPVAREPLTDEQIRELWHDSRPNRFEAISFARAIERAHGITGGNA